MEPSELETLVSELDGRVERLRALYDQYFMGIEKLEPLVPKKDVERRMALLRKEQIKNTGLRFRFQQIVSRYNTFLTYWQRISRQIEEGRYRRDVMRASRRFGIDPTRERATMTPPEGDEREKPDAPHVIEIPDGPIEEVYELDVEPDEPEGIPVPAFELDLEGPFEEIDPFPKPREAPVAASQLRIAPRVSAAPAAPAPPTGAGATDTERRIPVAPIARPATLPSQMPVAVVVPSMSPPRPLIRPTVSPAAPNAPNAPTGASVPAPPVTLGGVPLVRRASVPDPVEAGGASMRPPVVRPGPTIAPAPEGAVRRPGTLPSAVSIIPKAPVAPTIAPRTTAAPPAPGVARPPAAPGVAASRPPPAATVAPPQPVAGGTPRAATLVSAGVVPPAAPARSMAPAPPASGPSMRPPTASSPSLAPRAPVGDLSDDRFKQIYSEYVETRRKHNEPTGAITRDALAKQLSDSTSRLKQKHTGKSVDFEVVVKDGKTILRPVVK